MAGAVVIVVLAADLMSTGAPVRCSSCEPNSAGEAGRESPRWPRSTPGSWQRGRRRSPCRNGGVEGPAAARLTTPPRKPGARQWRPGATFGWAFEIAERGEGVGSKGQGWVRGADSAARSRRAPPHVDFPSVATPAAFKPRIEITSLRINARRAVQDDHRRQRSPHPRNSACDGRRQRQAQFPLHDQGVGGCAPRSMEDPTKVSRA